MHSLGIGSLFPIGTLNYWPNKTLCIDPSLKATKLVDIKSNPMGQRIENSDRCITDVGRFKCQIGPICWNIMTGKGYQSYQLSHQFVYLIIAKKVSLINSLIE